MHGAIVPDYFFPIDYEVHVHVPTIGSPLLVLINSKKFFYKNWLDVGMTSVL